MRYDLLKEHAPDLLKRQRVRVNKKAAAEASAAQVAELAEVSAENVRSYRMRRGIPATWRADSGVRINPAPPLPLAVRNATTLTARDGRWAFKVVAVSASAFVHERQEYLALGFVDYIEKPFRTEQIYGRSAGPGRSLLRRHFRTGDGCAKK